MTLFTTLACVLTGAHRVALPALLVNDYFCTECFIRNIDWIGGMAIRTGIGFLLDLS